MSEKKIPNVFEGKELSEEEESLVSGGAALVDMAQGLVDKTLGRGSVIPTRPNALNETESASNLLERD